MRRTAPLLAILIVVAAACGDDAFTPTTPATPTTAAATTEAPTTTSAPTTTEAPTTTAPATTTTQPATTTTSAPVYLVDPGDFMPDVLGQPGDPNGSGCVVDGDVLPDGIWFGFAEAVSAGVITFDLGCYFTGAAADAAADADYGTTDGAEEGFHVRNQNPKVFAVPIGAAAQVWYVAAAGPDWFPEPLPLASWPSATSWLPCPGDTCAVWLYVNGGAATGIVEQYLP